VKSIIALMSLTIFWASLVAAEHGTCDEQLLAIQNVRVFDGQASILKASVVIGCKRILKVLSGGKSGALPRESRVLDGRDHTLLPGLIDTHTHIWSVPMLARPLDFGVTTVMDMGSTNRKFAASMRTEREKGPAQDRADLYSAVLWVTAPGSHGTQWAEVPTLVEPEDAASFVATRVDEGADFIKIIYDNFKMFDADIPTLKRETMAATVDAAHARGMIAVVHSRDVEAWADVVEAGVDGIVHLPVDDVPDTELINLLKEKGIWVGGNLSLTRPLGKSLLEDPVIAPMLTETEKERLRDFTAKHRDGGDQVALNTVKALHAAGIKFLPGSDTPNGGTTTGATMHRDLEALVDIGFTPGEALQAATVDAAAAFRLVDRGRISEGLQADLLLVKGAPDHNIKDTRNIVAVIKAGKLHEGPLWPASDDMKWSNWIGHLVKGDNTTTDEVQDGKAKTQAIHR